MKISEHITNTIESWRIRWGLTLKEWMASWLSFGIEVFFDVLGKAAAPIFKPLVDKIEESAEVPPELKPLLDELKTPSGEVGAVLAQSAGGAIIGGAIGKITDALFMRFAYDVNTRLHPLILSPEEILKLWRRGLILADEVPPLLRKHGLEPEAILQMMDLTDWIPFAGDITNWVAKEVYEPDMVAKYGLMDEFPTAQLREYFKAGVNEEQAKNFWMAHWEHASWSQVTEMLHRGLLTEEEVWEWFRVVEIPPVWRDKLIAMSWELPTRVDIRRWWDMGTIDETRLRELYTSRGYHGKDLDDYILWTKVYVAFPDLITRYKNGWIDKETVLSEILALGMPEERAKILFETKFKKVGAERTATERDLTRADFIKGIKKGVITVAEGKQLLMGMGYDNEETDFIIAVHVETEGGSPANFAEYKRLEQLYRYSQGLPTERKPAEIAAAEKELAEKYPKKVPLTEAELKLRVDTTRRLRRSRQLTRDQEIASLLELGLTVDLATAYADNDDLRLRPEKEVK